MGLGEGAYNGIRIDMSRSYLIHSQAVVRCVCQQVHLRQAGLSIMAELVFVS